MLFYIANLVGWFLSPWTLMSEMQSRSCHSKSYLSSFPLTLYTIVLNLSCFYCIFTVRCTNLARNWFTSIRDSVDVVLSRHVLRLWVFIDCCTICGFWYLERSCFFFILFLNMMTFCFPFLDSFPSLKPLFFSEIFEFFFFSKSYIL